MNYAQIARAALEFLQRAGLQGGEVPQFIGVQGFLSSIVSGQLVVQSATEVKEESAPANND